MKMDISGVSLQSKEHGEQMDKQWNEDGADAGERSDASAAGPTNAIRIN